MISLSTDHVHRPQVLELLERDRSEVERESEIEEQVQRLSGHWSISYACLSICCHASTTVAPCESVCRDPVDVAVVAGQVLKREVGGATVRRRARWIGHNEH